MDQQQNSRTLVDQLALSTPPIAIAFRDSVPEGMQTLSSPEPAGCGYWRAAAEGKAFATVAADHFGCPIGAHTHGVALPPEKQQELEGMIGTMVGLQYLKMEDVPAIPHRTQPFGAALYAPLEKADFAPDVVLVRGNARQLMLLAEAAQSAGIAGDQPTLGRPTCAVLPQAMQSGRTATSFGCVGNRVYTGASEDDAYFAIPGQHLERLLERLAVITNANRELEKFHRGRLTS